MSALPADEASARRVVLVTGASSGIGQATARLFAARGARVFGTSRREVPDGHGVEMLRLDVGSAESVERCVGEVLDRAGRVDVLVNNAGVMHEGFAEETGRAEAESVFDVNFFGAVRVAHAVLPAMRARRRGHIVNVGSLAAWVGEPGEAFYAASKAALARYTEALRHEVWHLGVRVCLVEPGVFTTGVLTAASVSRARIADYDGPRESARRTLHDALRRGDDPGKAAELIVKVASSPAPRGRYGVGRQSGWVPLLKTLMPQRLFDTLLRRGYHLPR
jgi:NAD(P)-dependent dehydrogenase (short-subunit alcohol dehydrogenase family)